MNEEQRLAKANCLSSIDHDLHCEADKAYQEANAYQDHVWNGGDPTVVGGFRPEFGKGAIRFAKLIWNNYRLAHGEEPNIYSPASATHFKLFSILRDELGTWITGETLRRITRGQHVATYLKDYELRREGFVLQKQSFDGRVNYRLIEYSEVTGVKEPASA